MTGIGLGLTEYSQNAFGCYRIRGINFAASVPINPAIQREGRAGETVRVTESMATALLQAYEDRRIRHPRDAQLRDDLRKPEKVTSAGGRVSIAATRNEAGHADHFWSLALALEAARNAPMPGPGIEVFKLYGGATVVYLVATEKPRAAGCGCRREAGAPRAKNRSREAVMARGGLEGLFD